MDEIPYESGSYYIFDRGYNDYKRLYTIHQIGAFFVIRAKTNLHYNTEKWKRRMPDNVLSDQLITLSGFYSQQKYPEKIRKVIYWDDEQKREFTFLTNATEISALEVANLYKNRWQVELFFYVKHIVMRSDWKSISDYQGDTKTLLRSTSHNISYFFRPLSQSRRF